VTLQYRPLVFFWIAEYKDGSVLSQFDFVTGKENKFPWEDRDKFKRFGFVPFTPELSLKIVQNSGLITVPTDNPSFWVELKDGDKLIAKRENIIKFSLRGGGISRKIVYVLGKVGGKVMRIHEDGSVEEEHA